MRIKTKTTLIIIGVVALVAGASVVGWKEFHTSDTRTAPSGQSKKINDVNYDPPTQAEKQAGEQIKKQAAQNSSDTSPTSPTQNVTITISRLNQVSPGQNINLRTTLSSNVSDGECVAIFTQAGQTPITETAGIASNPSYYSCEPIDISPSQLGKGGTWQVVVYVQQDSSTVSNKATGSIAVQQ